MTSPLERLQQLAEAATLSPGPWELIWDQQGIQNMDGSPAPGTVPDRRSFRIVDAERRLLVRIAADPEQTLKAEDMAFIAECRVWVPLLLQAVHALRRAQDDLDQSVKHFERIATQLTGDLREYALQSARAARSGELVARAALAPLAGKPEPSELLPCTCRGDDPEPYCPRHTPLPGEAAAGKPEPE